MTDILCPYIFTVLGMIEHATLYLREKKLTLPLRHIGGVEL
jgi:hypothetical protein